MISNIEYAHYKFCCVVVGLKREAYFVDFLGAWKTAPGIPDCYPGMKKDLLGHSQ